MEYYVEWCKDNDIVADLKKGWAHV